MINKLWTGVSLENYNNWYPLTGKITKTPQQYIQTWSNAHDWFKTFAIRAQNDINAYLDFILSKFPFDSFKDELIKETLRDMVYVMVEHWVFNRTPIEFNVDATIQFNNGSQFSANSTPTINVWDLAPSRMKIWARLTELKQIFSSYNDDEIDVEKIDLKAFYTRNQVDELIEQQKEFTLLKQIKLYDDLVDDNENEIYRGPVSKFVNKGYVATDYDKETETMILDWPDEIGTLPPEALQNNPQIGDYTHAPTCDFSAKQQKRITTNENSIKLLETKVDNNIKLLANKIEINKQNIDDIKNNWFNIETSPLWKEISNELSIDNLNKEILVIWGYIYESDIYKYKYTRKSIFKLDEESAIKSYTLLDTFYSDKTNNIRLYLTCSNCKIRASATPGTYYSGFISNIYQYQGNGIPIEFIAEDSTERDYYTKIETNDLLDKKQDKLTAGENIKIKNNVISASGGGVDPNNYYTKPEVDKKLIETEQNFPIAFQLNALGQEIPILETTNKTIVGAINEVKTNIDKLNIIKWKNVGNKTNNTIEYNFKIDILYRIGYSWGLINDTGAVKYLIFIYRGAITELDSYFVGSSPNKKSVDNYTDLVVSSNKIYLSHVNDTTGFIYSLEEAQNINTKNYSEQILPIIPPIPPTPCPCPKWKEVGTKKDNKTIQFNFIKNKIYRIYYNYCATNDKTEYSWIYKEFIYSGNNNTEYLDSFIYTDGSYTWLQVNQNSIFMTTVPYPFTFGQLLKLEELQE
ncbi:hypothetical protein [Spiroplasma endosymbiont of Villa modesta]|uniref:hypothetical protein n=1 Tax=Spiroplasma endosymbiont of Villa modesta TaxID=3066293 RepID=UPI00313D253E